MERTIAPAPEEGMTEGAGLDEKMAMFGLKPEGGGNKALSPLRCVDVSMVAIKHEG